MKAERKALAPVTALAGNAGFGTYRGEPGQIVDKAAYDAAVASGAITELPKPVRMHKGGITLDFEPGDVEAHKRMGWAEEGIGLAIAANAGERSDDAAPGSQVDGHGLDLPAGDLKA